MFSATPDSRLPTPYPHEKYAMFYAQQLSSLKSFRYPVALVDAS
jgi:hypothetical protein